jgi:hypothetical protein
LELSPASLCGLLHFGTVSALVRTGLVRVFLARQHHARLEDHVLGYHAVSLERVKHCMQDGFRDDGAARETVIAVEEHFRFDDGNEPFTLAHGRVTREDLGVDFDPQARRVILRNG